MSLEEKKKFMQCRITWYQEKWLCKITFIKWRNGQENIDNNSKLQDNHFWQSSSVYWNQETLTLMTSEENCDNLIKCPSLWLFSVSVKRLYTFMHSGSVMCCVMPRTPETNYASRSSLSNKTLELSSMSLCRPVMTKPVSTVLQQCDE